MNDFEACEELLLNAAATLEKGAAEMRRIHAGMLKHGDITHMAEAVNHVSSLVGQLRLDLFVTRPLRLKEHELADLKSQKGFGHDRPRPTAIG